MPPVSEKQPRQIIVTAGLDPAVHLVRENFFAMDARVISASTRVHSRPKGRVRPSSRGMDGRERLEDALLSAHDAESDK